MGLSIYLSVPSDYGAIRPVDRVFVRENGQVREVSREEWNQKFPGAEPVKVSNPDAELQVFESHITHNLSQMAEDAGIYKHLWHPEDVGITKASQLIEPLRNGLALLLSKPDDFKKLNPTNGWGSYDVFVHKVREYLEACDQYPEARVSR